MNPLWLASIFLATQVAGADICMFLPGSFGARFDPRGFRIHEIDQRCCFFGWFDPPQVVEGFTASPAKALGLMWLDAL